ncbi:MAG: hypothetical protein DI582_02555 [Azospirillum brasilense]|nr:MAG: hypothetical protein DI582_02555 [Azospirillum brasilense]
MRSSRVWLIAAVLAFIGLSILLYKHLVLEFPISPNTTYNSWYVEARVDLSSTESWKKGDKPLLFSMQLPHASDKFVLVDENIVARDFGYEIEKQAPDNRVAVFSKRRISDQETIFYRAIVYELDSPTSVKINAPDVPRSPYSKSQRPTVEEGQKEQPIYVAVDALIDEAREKSASPKTFVREIYKLARNPEDDRIQLIRDTVDARMSATDIAVLLLEAAEIPTRIAHGLRLTRDQRKGQFVDWLETFIGGKWQAIDPEKHTFGLEDKYIVWWYGTQPLHVLDAGKAHVESYVSVRQNTNDALTRAIWKSGQRGNVFLTFSFYNLPLDTQILFKVLLMIPVGGLMIAFLRQVIGVKTFGTFMPVLVALAFRETGLVTGLFLFMLVVGLGLVIRNYFDQLKLLLVPRLAAVLTVVVMVLSLLAMITNQVGLVVGLSISLFPIVILTMTIERMTLMWEEYGSREALKVGFSSLFAAVLAFFAMNNETLGHLMFAFPELLLVVLALAMLLGRYNHYKLTEYVRFRALQKSLAELEAREAAKRSTPPAE